MSFVFGTLNLHLILDEIRSNLDCVVYFEGVERGARRQVESCERVLRAPRLHVLLHSGEDGASEHRGSATDQGHSHCEFRVVLQAFAHPHAGRAPGRHLRVQWEHLVAAAGAFQWLIPLQGSQGQMVFDGC